MVVLFGFLVGILIGLTGVGGGSLMTPLLLVAGYSPVVAIGTDLAYGAITKTVGGWRHLRAGNVDLRLSWWLAAGSVPGAVLGVLVLNRLDRPANCAWSWAGWSGGSALMRRCRCRRSPRWAGSIARAP